MLMREAFKCAPTLNGVGDVANRMHVTPPYKVKISFHKTIHRVNPYCLIFRLYIAKSVNPDTTCLM